MMIVMDLTTLTTTLRDNKMYNRKVTNNQASQVR
jgi:hypothetical protein